jgi:hypothetical protein
MDELKWLQDAAGQPLAPPEIDVTSAVMRTLRERRSAPTAVPMLFAVALASWMLAGAVVLVAYHAVSAWQDPLADLLRL